MKIKPEHYATLKAEIQTWGANGTLAYWQEQYKLKGLSEKRFRWDVLYASKIKVGDGVGMQGLPLYAYLDDSHIDTALKRIIAELCPDSPSTP